MTENALELDTLEAKIVSRAGDTAVTRRRIVYSILVPSGLIAMVVAFFWRDAQPRTLLWLFLIYVAVNMLEKVGYGFAVLGYKSVIRKLVARVQELERA